MRGVVCLPLPAGAGADWDAFDSVGGGVADGVGVVGVFACCVGEDEVAEFEGEGEECRAGHFDGVFEWEDWLTMRYRGFQIFMVSPCSAE